MISPYKKKVFLLTAISKKAGVILQRAKTAAPYTVYLNYQLTVGMQITLFTSFGINW